MEIDESDQASIVGFMFGTHLKKHGGVPDPECSFCKNFIISDRKEEDYPLASYSFLIFDVSDDKRDNRVVKATGDVPDVGTT